VGDATDRPDPARAWRPASPQRAAHRARPRRHCGRRAEASPVGSAAESGGGAWRGGNGAGTTRTRRPGGASPGRCAGGRGRVAGARRLKAIGTRHCFNDVADFAGGELVSLAGLPAGIDIDRSRHTATVGAATTYGELAPVLDAAGYGLANLASLPHCSVAGSVATATHGSGERHRNLAAAASAVALVTADRPPPPWSPRRGH